MGQTNSIFSGAEGHLRIHKQAGARRALYGESSEEAQHLGKLRGSKKLDQIKHRYTV